MMKKKKIELGRKLFLKKETVAGLNAEESSKVLGGGWVTHVAQTAYDPNPVPECMYCPLTMQNGCPTHVYSQCQTYFVNNVCCSISGPTP